jgi:hypothetical protein
MSEICRPWSAVLSILLIMLSLLNAKKTENEITNFVISLSMNTRGMISSCYSLIISCDGPLDVSISDSIEPSWIISHTFYWSAVINAEEQLYLWEYVFAVSFDRHGNLVRLVANMIELVIASSLFTYPSCHHHRRVFLLPHSPYSASDYLDAIRISQDNKPVPHSTAVT